MKKECEKSLSRFNNEKKSFMSPTRIDSFGQHLRLPKISVLILTYNFENFLSECIESILAQTLRPIEILISDDCSTDDSWSIISKYSLQYPELIKAHRQERNVGPHHNALFNIKRATGDLICGIDGDDLWLPRKLELEWKALQRHPEARIAYSNVYNVDAEGNCIGIWYTGQGPAPPTGDVFIKVASRNFFPNKKSIFRNELTYRFLYDEIPYDENVKIFKDYDFKLRATAQYPVVYSGEALVERRLHDKGIHNLPFQIRSKDQLYVYQKNLYLLDSRPEKEAIEIKNQWRRLNCENALSYGLESSENNPHELNQKGEELFINGSIEGAINAFEGALKMDPNFAQAYNNLAVLYFQKSEINKALTCIEKAFNIDSNNRITIMNYASLLKMLNKLDALRQVYAYYLKNNSHDKEITRAFQELNG